MRTWWMLLLVVPAAGAQWTYDVELSASGPEFIQVREYSTYELEWTVTCRVAPSAGAGPTSTWAARLSLEHVEGVLVSAPLVAPFEGPDCTTAQSATGEIQWQIGATGALPGLVVTEMPIGIEIAWGGGATPAGSVAGQGTLDIMPDYHGLIEAKAPVKLQQAEPGARTEYAVQITNFGNARTVVDIASEGRGIEVPSSWPEGGLAAGDSGVLIVVFNHPEKAGWNNEQGLLELVLTPRSFDDENKTGDPVSISLVGRTRGTPAPGLGLGLIPLVVAAARRR